MATGYLRPSADVSLTHSCNTGSKGYSLMNEVTQDGDSTYIYLVNSSTQSSKNTTSTFTVSGTLPGFDYGVINSSTLHVWYKVEVESEGSESKTEWSGNVTVDSTSASWSGSDDTDTYIESTATLPTSGYNFGIATNKTASVYTNLYNGQTKDTDSYHRITQIYIQVEYTGYWYVDSSLVWGCGCTCPARQTIQDGNSTTLTFTLDSGKQISKLLDNGNDVTSSVTQSGTTATYTISNVAARHTIQVFTELPYFKQSGAWKEVKGLYKKVNGSWVEQTDFHDLFDINKNYHKEN